MRCAFSNREIDFAYPGWLKTPDNKVVLAQFYEVYIKNISKEEPIQATDTKVLEVKLSDVVTLTNKTETKAAKKPGPKSKKTMEPKVKETLAPNTKVKKELESETPIRTDPAA